MIKTRQNLNIVYLAAFIGLILQFRFTSMYRLGDRSTKETNKNTSYSADWSS